MKKTGKNIIILFLATSLAKFIAMFKSFFLAKILEPGDYGIWITLLLIVSYSGIISFGIIEALLKQVPFFLGKKDDISRKRVEDCVLGFLFLLSIIILIIGFTFHLFVKHEKILTMIPHIRLMFLSLALNIYFSYFYFRFSAYQNFKMVGFLDTFKSVLIGVLQIPLAYFLGLFGVILGFFISMVILCGTALFTNIKELGKVFFRFDLKLSIKLIKIGLPITIFFWLSIIQTSVDRIIAISLLGEEATGFYGLGVALFSVLILIPKAVGRVLYPKINEKFGERENKHDLVSLVEKPASIMSLLIPVMINAVICGLPIVYTLLLPKYSQGLLSAQILIMATFFSGLTKNGTNFLITINKKKLVIFYLLISIIVNIIGNIIFLKLDFYINGLAISTTLSFIVLSTLIWLSVYKNLDKSLFEAIKKIFIFYFPFFLILMIFIILYIFFNNLLFTVSFYLPVFFIIMTVSLFGSLFFIPYYNILIKKMIIELKAQLKK